MISYKIASEEDMKSLMQVRMEMLKESNGLPEDHKFDYKFIMTIKNYFENEDHTTILALDENKVVGCASLCYYKMMPSFTHPEDKRACLTNVYVNKEYRRQGIASMMVDILVDMCKAKKVSEINTYSNDTAKGLYEKFDFASSSELLILDFNAPKEELEEEQAEEQEAEN